MTISSARKIAKDRTFPAVQSDSSDLPPPKLHEPADFPFKGYRAPQPDGYRQSAATPGESAIVIDNGEMSHLNRPNMCADGHDQEPISSKQVSPSIKHHDSLLLPSWHVTEIGS